MDPLCIITIIPVKDLVWFGFTLITIDMLVYLYMYSALNYLLHCETNLDFYFLSH